MNRRLAIAGLLMVAVLLGALREFLFLNLNYQLDHLVRHTDVSYAHSLFQGWVAGWSVGALEMLKWTLTGGFILVMTGASILLSRLLFGDHRYRRTILLVVGTLALVAFLLHAFSAGSEGCRSVAVQMIHALQYPVPLLILLLASRLPGTAPKG